MTFTAKKEGAPLIFQQRKEKYGDKKKEFVENNFRKVFNQNLGDIKLKKFKKPKYAEKLEAMEQRQYLYINVPLDIEKAIY